jgi:hypothetical protein
MEEMRLLNLEDQIMTGVTVLFDKEEILIIPEEWVLAV